MKDEKRMTEKQIAGCVNELGEDADISEDDAGDRVNRKLRSRVADPKHLNEKIKQKKKKEELIQI